MGCLLGGACLWPAGQGVAVAAADPAGARPTQGTSKGSPSRCSGCWAPGVVAGLASRAGERARDLAGPAARHPSGLAGRAGVVTARRAHFALAFIWLALVIGIDGSLLIAQLTGALAAFAGFPCPARRLAEVR